MAFALLPSEDIALELASSVRSRRLAQRLTQEGLASRSGVPFGTLKSLSVQGKLPLFHLFVLLPP